MKLIFDENHQYKLHSLLNSVNTQSSADKDKRGVSAYRIALSINNAMVTDLIPDLKSIFSDEKYAGHATIDKENGTEPFVFKFGALISLSMYTNEDGFFVSLVVDRPTA